MFRTCRDQLGDFVDFRKRHVQRAPGVADHGLGSHGSEGDNLADVFAAVFFRDVVDHLAAAAHAEIDIDIGKGDPLGIKEALKQQVVLKRVDIRDVESVGNQAARRRAAARPHRNALFARKADEIPHDQEIACDTASA